MPPYIFYDRRTVNAVKVQFFHESRGKHAKKDLGTNMEKDLQFPYDVTVRKIVLVPELQVISTTTARDTGKIDDLATFLKSGILRIQVGEGRIELYPAAAALSSINASGALHYTLATAADGTLNISSLSGPLDTSGLDVQIRVPANTDFKFFVEQEAATDIGDLQVYLLVDRP